MFNDRIKKSILSLAHQSIDYYFQHKSILSENEIDKVNDKLKQQLACFVTLTINGKLRGCVGHLEATQPLYLDIIDNAVKAAFNDDRFLPLTLEEFKKIKIEVSVLSKPEKINFFDTQELLNKITPRVDGVILKHNNYSATYLPQVWQDLPDKQEFLSSLCQKAGLPADDWQKEGIEVWKYQVEIVK